MTYDPLDEMFRRIDLTRAMEGQFGTCRDWPLHLRAAHAQLEQLRRLLGDTHYETFTESAVEAIRRRAESQDSRDLHGEHLGRQLHQRVQALGGEAAHVAWAIGCGLTVLLDDEQYEKVITASAAACRTGGSAAGPGSGGVPTDAFAGIAPDA
ncbi:MULTISPECIES: hypothetical protein [unclassified Streptomyces]|uniref:hypothetical protein n=1 Tax=unclassified Streptomyces TaxID=2593676 RepID=UPI00332B484F